MLNSIQFRCIPPRHYPLRQIQQVLCPASNSSTKKIATGTTNMGDKRRSYTPRQDVTRVCAYETCQRTFTAFRVTLKYCCPAHQAAAWRLTHRPLRAAVLKRDGGACRDCGSDKGRMFVRAEPGVPPTLDTARTLCGRCHSEVSRRAFREGHPEARQGDNYRRNIAKVTGTAT